MQLPMRLLLGVLACGVTSAAGVSSAQRNFIACPIVRDTQTVPCWLAEYEGEWYFLGLQGDPDWRPPLLGRRVLVEGVVSDAYRVCGGVVLRPVVVSPLPDADATCSVQVLPAEERYTVPVAAHGFTAASDASVVQREFIIRYDFDSVAIGAQGAHILENVVRSARVLKPGRIEVIGFGGGTLLSNGTPFMEHGAIAERRARSVAQSLIAAGTERAQVVVRWQPLVDQPDGERDYERRRVVLRLTNDE